MRQLSPYLLRYMPIQILTLLRINPRFLEPENGASPEGGRDHGQMKYDVFPKGATIVGVETNMIRDDMEMVFKYKVPGDDQEHSGSAEFAMYQLWVKKEDPSISVWGSEQCSSTTSSTSLSPCLEIQPVEDQEDDEGDFVGLMQLSNVELSDLSQLRMQEEELQRFEALFDALADHQGQGRGAEARWGLQCVL